jgi:5-methylcytosine-specific restriction endonuclease McrA
MTKREIQVAVLGSKLEWPARLILLTLLSFVKDDASEPPALSLSLNEIKTATGLGRATVARWLGRLERLGWIIRLRSSSVQGSPERTRYRVVAGDHGPVFPKPESTYRKAKIPTSVRLEVAIRYGARPGDSCYVPCHHCGVLGRVDWPIKRATAHWVVFEHELDHLIPESLGGETIADNLVLSCSPCNRQKGNRVDWTPVAVAGGSRGA